MCIFFKRLLFCITCKYDRYSNKNVYDKDRKNTDRYRALQKIAEDMKYDCN